MDRESRPIPAESKRFDPRQNEVSALNQPTPLNSQRYERRPLVFNHNQSLIRGNISELLLVTTWPINGDSLGFRRGAHSKGNDGLVFAQIAITGDHPLG